MSYRNSIASKMEENAVQEAASGLESVEKLIRLLSQTQQNGNNNNINNQEIYQSSSPISTKSSMDLEMDCKAAADVVVSKFKKVITLLGRTRTGHARFRRAPVVAATPAPVNQTQTNQEHETKVYYATPIQQIPPPVTYHQPHHHHDFLTMKSGGLERKDSSTTINFSYSSAGNSFMSSLTGDTDSKQQQQPSSSSAFQITNLSQVSSAGKPPLSSSLKRKCSSENLGSAKCSGSSGRCHCSKKRYSIKLLIHV